MEGPDHGNGWWKGTEKMQIIDESGNPMQIDHVRAISHAYGFGAKLRPIIRKERRSRGKIREARDRPSEVSASQTSLEASQPLLRRVELNDGVIERMFV